MKVIVLLSLVALCVSTPISGGKRITVGEDGTITVIGAQGAEIDIYRSAVGSKTLNIVIKGQNGGRKIQLDDQIDNILNLDLSLLNSKILNTIPKNEITQLDVLVSIFAEHQGLVDDETYNVLLGRIEALVNNGILSVPVLQSLRSFEQLNLNVLRQVSGVAPVEGELFGLNQYGNIMPNQGNVMPIQGNALPIQGNVLPIQGNVLPIQGNVLPIQGNVLPIQGNYGIQGLWNLQNVTPFQRSQMLLQLIQQQRQLQQLQQDLLPIGLLKEKDLNKKLIHQLIVQQRLAQLKMSPLNRFLYNTGVLGGNSYPQQWTTIGQQQIVPQQLINQIPQVGQFVNQQVPQQLVYPQQLVHPQVYPQQLVRPQAYPQQWVAPQVFPQQYVQQPYVVPEVQDLYEQEQVLNQQQNGVQRMGLAY